MLRQSAVSAQYGHLTEGMIFDARLLMRGSSCGCSSGFAG
jgi:hypothetical protein